MERRWLKLAHSYQFLTSSTYLRHTTAREEQSFPEGWEQLNQIVGKQSEVALKLAQTHHRSTIAYLSARESRSRNSKTTVMLMALVYARWRLAMMEQTLARMEAEHAAANQ
jgi:hypothetical protein